MSTVPRWQPRSQTLPVTDEWDSRFPPNFAVVDMEAAKPQLDAWRKHARMMAAGGKLIEFADAPMNIERGRARTSPWDVNGADWINNGRLGGVKS